MISVCMASYNGEKFIKEQIDSILAQLNEEDELIISDDGSSDNTLPIIANYNDNRIKLLHNLPPHGVIHNFENALNFASGDYIFLSDQDDIWLPGRKNKVMEQFNTGKQLIVVNAQIIDSKNNCIGKSFFELNHSRSGFWNNFKHNGFLGCCMAFSKDTLPISLPFPENLPMHDWWIGLILLAHKTPCTFLDMPLHSYRKHGHNVSNSGGISPFSFRKKIFMRFQMALKIITRLIKIRFYN